MSKVYIIISSAEGNFDRVKFHSYVKSLHASSYIKSWWHYIPGGQYFFTSDLEVNQLYNLFAKHLPGRYFVIMEVDVKNRQGWLPKKAWDWFKKYQ
jgi:hypothetical protein